MSVRMRVTLRTKGDRVADLRAAAGLRGEIWSHSPVAVDPEHPLRGIHRDQSGKAYFEFATESPDRVRSILEKPENFGVADMTEEPPPPGEECVNCGNVAGPAQPTVCPNCQFRDVTPCPVCDKEVPRDSYIRIGGDLFHCPNCESRVRLRFNSPMFRPDGSYNQPLVVVEEARAIHEVR